MLNVAIAEVLTHQPAVAHPSITTVEKILSKPIFKIEFTYVFFYKEALHVYESGIFNFSD